MKLFKMFTLALCSLLLPNVLYGQIMDNIAFSVDGLATSKKDLQKQFDQYKTYYDSTITIQEFVDAEINKQLIIAEAKKKGADTTLTYLTDLKSVKTELLSQYLKPFIPNNKKEKETLINRFSKQLEVNHAFIPFLSTTIFAKDTLAYYNEALDTRALALENGFQQFEKNNSFESFGVVFDVEKYNGYVGWISPFMFADNLENVLYNLKMGEISMPVRGSDGYHIFQVTNQRSVQGNPIIEMIMFNFPVIPATEHMIDSVYQVAVNTYDEISIKNNFPQICNEFLMAMNSDQEDCTFGEINNRSQIPYPIINSAFQLTTPGEISKPILCDYGFAIIKLKEKLPPPDSAGIKKRVEDITNSDYFKALNFIKYRKYYIDSLGVDINPVIYDSILAISDKYFPTDSLFVKNLPNSNTPFITLNDSIIFTVSNFRIYFNIIKEIYKPIDPKSADILTGTATSIMKYSLSSDMIKDAINDYIMEAIKQTERDNLENNNKEYSDLLNKFKVDLLYTDFMNQEVWKRSRTDFSGLENYFQEHKQNYKLNSPKLKGWVVFSDDPEILEMIKKKDPKTTDQMDQLIKKYKTSYKIDAQYGSWEEGQNSFVDYMIFKKGEKPKIGEKKFTDFIVLGEKIYDPIDFWDVYDDVQSDYQIHLEQDLKNRIINTYSVIKSNEVIDSIK